MNADLVMRRALWVSVPFNVFGACLFAFPGSALGQLAGLPAEPVPAIYCAALAAFVLLFGGLYGWMALQPRIPRELAAFSALGKGSMFSLIAVFALLGLGPVKAVVPALGDAVLAAIFVWWLVRTRNAA